MKINHNRTLGSSAVIVFVAIALVVSLASAYGPLPVASGQSQPSEPAASIDKIVVNETNQIEALGNVIVTRANGEKVQAVTTGLLLYRGDTIETARNTKVTVLFLDSPVPEKHNQIIIDGDAKVGISSGDSWWGRVWAKVNGIFFSRTTYVQVGAHGTEYEFNVSKDGRQATVVMLEGDFLDVTRGTFRLAGRVASIGPRQEDAPTRAPQFITASFSREDSEQEQPGRSLDVPTGQLTPFEVTYSIFNECHQRHRFEFRTSDDSPWLQLEVQKSWDIAPSQRVPITAKLTVDARQLAPGQHRGHVYLVCLDCNREAQCPGSQLDWPYNVKVGDATTPTPTPLPSPSPSPTTSRLIKLTELQEVVVPNGPEPAAPERASDDRVRAALEWTNRVILKTQPSYSAEGIFPHFAAVEQRSQNFRTAREQAILRHQPGSNKVLGDIYSDWGQAAQAAKAYDIERKNSAGPRTPSQSFSVDQAEAQRLIGNPDQARQMIQANFDSRSAAAQNLLGNIYADYARIDFDKRDWNQARTNLDQAEVFYRSALSPARGPQSATAGDGAVQANLAKTQILQGDLFLREALGSRVDPPAALAATSAAQINAAQQARIRYAAALQSLANSKPAETNYPFGVQTLGRAYQGLGDAATLAGESAAAVDSYASAKSHYNRVIAAHPDCAEAYFSLGDLYEDLGELENAKLNYRRAIQTRPEQPASYYPLAVLLQTEDPNLAKALAATYLQLEPRIFQQGEKARNAERITRGEQVPPPLRIGTGNTVRGRVPGVVNKPLAQATTELKNAAFRIGRIDRRPDARPVDTVIEQSLAAGTPAPRELVINLIVSSGPVLEPTVPNVKDMSLAQATTLIEQASLRVGKVTEKPDNDKPQGIVSKQKPEAGKRVTAGSPVELEVTTPRPVEVPELIDDREETARKKILDKRLTVGNVSQRAACESLGKVIQQNPIKKTRVLPGSAVDFVVGSLGDNPVSVPRFIGGSRNDAEMAIRERSFQLAKVRMQETDDARPGTVMDQSPREGTQFAQNCPVRIEITIAEPLTSVGNYIGMSESEARRQLSAIRLSADVRYEASRDNPGVVLNQSPPPESRVRRGSQVALIVSMQPVKVPYVIGKSLEEAQQILAGAGLVVGSVRRVADRGSDYPAGSVISQDPNAEQIVAAGTRVNLQVRAAPRQPQSVPVPRVYNMSERDARLTIERAGLRVGAVGCVQASQFPTRGGEGGVRAGNATGTDPVEGTSLPAGTAVTLIIARSTCGEEGRQEK